jgi:hypothetical protein
VRDVAVGASTDEVGAVARVEEAIERLIQETRNMNQANAARASSGRR